MIVRIDHTSEEPLYLQIRSQIIAAIACGALKPLEPLPSVRTLACDLGINLHTVNKAYALLRDEGYLVMHGRSQTRVADPGSVAATRKASTETLKMEGELYALALAHRARGGSEEEFLQSVRHQLKSAFTIPSEPNGQA
ncbi:MAG: GntR family transcriptional regulator [Coriobacteriaceae bacterium]|jgi:DNA-binding transcriptional regulator YhcF (GntR family)|nr:GntR family transcriptional regulator [Coriobacteriaceae bacterium]